MAGKGPPPKSKSRRARRDRPVRGEWTVPPTECPGRRSVGRASPNARCSVGHRVVIAGLLHVCGYRGSGAKKPPWGGRSNTNAASRTSADTIPETRRAVPTWQTLWLSQQRQRCNRSAITDPVNDVVVNLAFEDPLAINSFGVDANPMPPCQRSSPPSSSNEHRCPTVQLRRGLVHP